MSVITQLCARAWSWFANFHREMVRGMDLTQMAKYSQLNLMSGDRDLFSPFAPPAEILISSRSLVARIDLPGVTDDDVDVTVFSDRIVISGQRAQPLNLSHCCISEPEYGPFRRTLSLPPGFAKCELLRMNLRAGVLEIVLVK